MRMSANKTTGGKKTHAHRHLFGMQHSGILHHASLPLLNDQYSFKIKSVLSLRMKNSISVIVSAGKTGT